MNPVCLTIDDAPSETFLDKLDVLDRYGIRAVWFCQGNLMTVRPGEVQEAIQRGHVIGNHSYSHPSFETLEIDQGIAEIRITDAIINELHVQAQRPRPHRFFRFPYGNKGNGPPSAYLDEPELVGKRRAYQDCLRSLGYTAPALPNPVDDVDWMWSFSTNDWSPYYPKVGLPDFTTPAQVVAAARAWNPVQTDDGKPEIVIMHDTPGAAAHHLFCDLIEVLAAKGLPFAEFDG